MTEHTQTDTDKYGFDTKAIRAGTMRSEFGEHSDGLYLTSSFVYASAADAAKHFKGEVPGGYIYSRFTNPTVRSFEQRLAKLEGAERCVATASGMAAIMATIMGLLQAGDHIVCATAVFGSTTILLEKYVAKFGIATTFVELTDTGAWQSAIQTNTKLFYVESPSNPLGDIADIKALADIAKAHNILLAVDNCFCTPALQQPFSLGADIVIHSATKYIDGQGRALGGAVLGSNKLMEEVYGVVRTCGPSLSPFNAWLFLKGLETLRLRMYAHSSAALTLATWLQAHPNVEKVYYAGLPTHSAHQLAKAQQSAFGGIVSFVVKGGQAGAWSVIDATTMLSITANLGDTRSTITHPATTTHGRLTPEAKLASGIDDGLIRVSVGLEDVADIINDLSVGLSAL